METVILKGKLAEVEACVNAISSQTGVTHAKVHIISRWLRPLKGMEFELYSVFKNDFNLDRGI
jgi:NikR C terminal nickel binding domain